MSDAPRVASVDQLAQSTRYAVLFQRVKARPLAKLLRDAVLRMNAAGDDADSLYHAALAALREAGTKAIDSLAQELRATDKRDYVNRWALVQLLTDLKDERALRILQSVIESPLPNEESRDPHGSTVARELVVRTTAVDGIAHLAAADVGKASEALFNYVAHPVRSIRIAAVLACIELGGQRAREELNRRMPKSDRWMLGIRRVHPREIPPIQGHRFLPSKSSPERIAVPVPERRRNAPAPPSNRPDRPRPRKG